MSYLNRLFLTFLSSRLAGTDGQAESRPKCRRKIGHPNLVDPDAASREEMIEEILRREKVQTVEERTTRMAFVKDSFIALGIDLDQDEAELIDLAKKREEYEAQL